MAEWQIGIMRDDPQFPLQLLDVFRMMHPSQNIRSYVTTKNPSNMSGQHVFHDWPNLHQERGILQRIDREVSYEMPLSGTVKGTCRFQVELKIHSVTIEEVYMVMSSILFSSVCIRHFDTMDQFPWEILFSQYLIKRKKGLQPV